MAAEFPKKPAHDASFRTTSSLRQRFPEKTGSWRQIFREKLAHDGSVSEKKQAHGGRGFRKNWLTTADVSGNTGSWRQRFPEKLTHQTTLMTYNSPQFRYFPLHNYFEVILATNCSLVTASVLTGNGLT